MTFRLLSILLCLAPLAAPAADSLLKLEEQAFKDAAATVAPSVVQIQTFGGLDRVGETLTGVGPTSGVVVSPDGYIATSAFAFASKPAAAVVRLPDGSQHDAKIVATDYSRMLTLLKIDAAGLPVPETTPVADAKVGEWTVAVGKAFDPVVPNISPGVLSAKDRIWSKAIQTDAKTSPFNYGGPLLDVRGRTLGVIVPLSMTSDEVMAGADWYDSGIGFAVPFDQVLASFERLKAGEDLHRGTLGVVTKEPGKMFATPVVAKVRDGSPAAEAGLKPDDVIVAIDGRPVVRHADVLRALGPKYAGDQTEIKVKRGDEETTVTVTLEKPTNESILPEQKPAEQPGGDKQDEK
jgi:serine protease Do